ncbi:MAG: hypothetical protein ACRDH6_07500 [Actinomycetota bacterium]
MSAARVDGAVRIALILLLVLLMVLLSAPFALGTSAMDPCPACAAQGAAAGWGLCLAVLALFTLARPRLGRVIVSRPTHLHPLLLVDPPDMPPRIA